MKTIQLLIIGAALALVSACSKSEGSGPDGQGGSTARFATVGNYMYTVDVQNLRVFDLSDPANPVFKGGFSLGEQIETIFAKDDKQLLVGGRNATYIIDISKPLQPSKLAQVSHIYTCDPVVADDKYAYVTLRSDGRRCGITENLLRILDISNPSDVKIVTAYSMMAPRGLGIDRNLLFVCDDGIKVYNRDDVKNLVKLQHLKGQEYYDLIPGGRSLIVTGSDGVLQYDYTNDTLVFLSKIPLVLPSI